MIGELEEVEYEGLNSFLRYTINQNERATESGNPYTEPNLETLVEINADIATMFWNYIDVVSQTVFNLKSYAANIYQAITPERHIMTRRSMHFLLLGKVFTI